MSNSFSFCNYTRTDGICSLRSFKNDPRYSHVGDNDYFAFGLVQDKELAPQISNPGNVYKSILYKSLHINLRI